MEEVPELTRLWKPESAPQATDTNSSGNILPEAVVKPVKAGAVI